MNNYPDEKNYDQTIIAESARLRELSERLERESREPIASRATRYRANLIRLGIVSNSNQQGDIK